MRVANLSTIVAVLALTTAVLGGPAAATDTGTAIGICTSRGPDCTITNKSDGGYHICVNNSGGQQCVDCPPLMGSGSSSCSVAAAKGKPKGTTVEGILNKASNKAVR
jgi:hypothetical protein